MRIEYLYKIATIWADQISQVPKIKNEKFNNFLNRSNALEKMRWASWECLTAAHGVSAAYVEKNISGNWTLNVASVLSYKRLNRDRLIQIRLQVDKITNPAGRQAIQIREYNLIIHNNKIKHVQLRHAVEDYNGNLSYDVLKINDIFKIGMRTSEPEIIDLKVIPVVLIKGHLGDGITLEHRVKELLNKTTILWKQFLDQAALSGAKFLINGSLIESGNLQDEEQEAKIVKSLLDGKNVVIYDGQQNPEAPTIENIGITNNLQEFRSNMDWILNKMKELSLAPDFNSADKGTANVHGAEVDASMYIKQEHLKRWKILKNKEWNDIYNIWSLRAEGTKAKEEIEPDLSNKNQEQRQEKKMKGVKDGDISQNNAKQA